MANWNYEAYHARYDNNAFADLAIYANGKGLDAAGVASYLDGCTDFALAMATVNKLATHEGIVRDCLEMLPRDHIMWTCPESLFGRAIHYAIRFCLKSTMIYDPMSDASYVEALIALEAATDAEWDGIQRAAWQALSEDDICPNCGRSADCGEEKCMDEFHGFWIDDPESNRNQRPYTLTLQGWLWWDDEDGGDLDDEGLSAKLSNTTDFEHEDVSDSAASNDSIVSETSVTNSVTQDE